MATVGAFINHRKLTNTLFIGNGLNRTISGLPSWESLLKTVANTTNTVFDSKNPLPIEFERMVNVFMAPQTPPGYDSTTRGLLAEIKEKLAAEICKFSLPDIAVHRRIARLHLKDLSIVTTNYDHMLEQVFQTDYFYETNDTNYDFIMRETGFLDGVHFYHAHGIIDIPSSICLGANQYVHIASSLQKSIAEEIPFRGGKNMGRPKNTFPIRKVLLGQDNRTELSWGELFFTSNMAFIGFELSPCETDIWWLISYRAYLFYSNYCHMRTTINNTLVYYKIIDVSNREFNVKDPQASLTEEEKSNIQLLRNMHILVKPCYLNDESGIHNEAHQREAYAKVYNSIFDDIEKHGIGKVQECSLLINC